MPEYADSVKVGTDGKIDSGRGSLARGRNELSFELRRITMPSGYPVLRVCRDPAKLRA